MCNGEFEQVIEGITDRKTLGASDQNHYLFSTLIQELMPWKQGLNVNGRQLDLVLSLSPHSCLPANKSLNLSATDSSLLNTELRLCQGPNPHLKFFSEFDVNTELSILSKKIFSRYIIKEITDLSKEGRYYFYLKISLLLT